jgi:hypothetical protein
MQMLIKYNLELLFALQQLGWHKKKVFRMLAPSLSYYFGYIGTHGHGAKFHGAKIVLTKTTKAKK